MQSLYPVEKAIRLGGPLGIGGQGQELRYVSGLYMPAHGVLADAIFPRYAAICALPSRQQLLDSKALLVRANGTDPTQLLLLIHAVMSAAPALLRARPLVLRDGLPGPRREARGSPAPTFLQAGYHGLWRAYAVTSGIAAHHLLAFLGCRSSFGQTQTIRTTRRTHAAPPLIRICSIASSPARSQLLSAARKATGSFANPASCIRSSHSSWAERSTVSFSWAESSA